jgi:hypothetical protein
MTDDQPDQMPSLDDLSPEEREAAQQAIDEIATDAKVNFALADFLQGGRPKKGNVLVYRDLDAVAEYVKAQARLGEAEVDLLKLTSSEDGKSVPSDDEVNAAKAAHAEAEQATDDARKTMLQGAINIIFRPILGDTDDRVRAQARKLYYPGGQAVDEDAAVHSADWIERTELGHAIQAMKTATGEIPIQNRDRVGHDLHGLLDFTQWTRLVTSWQVYRFGDAVADAAVSDPGF